MVSVKEGINLPRYPSLPGRLRAKRAVIERHEPQWQAEGLRKQSLRVPETERKQAKVLGHRGGRGARAHRRARRVGGAAMTVLCLVEHDAAGVADAVAARAVVRPRRLADAAGEPDGVAAVLFGPAGQVPGDALAAHGATSAHVVEPGDLPGYAPRAWARALAGLAAQTGADAVLAAATDRGNEVMAHLAALIGLPMAANCLAVDAAEAAPTSSSGSAGRACCSRTPPWTPRPRC